MGDKDAVTVRVETRIQDIAAEQWDRCAAGSGCGEAQGIPPNPFVSYDFLAALEESGCVRAETGWLPQHLVVEDPAGGIAACMPCYLKNHSQGEYVFDHGWADAFERAGGRYYPKLQTSVPFTPVTGPRLLTRGDGAPNVLRRALAEAAITLCERLGASSWHVTFAERAEYDDLAELGMLQRTGQQFHWLNQNYQNFDDFLAALTSRKRKAIKRERREALASGIEVEWLTGNDIREHHWDAFFDFYMDTGARKWGQPYLNRAFFSRLGERMADRVLLIMAKDGAKHGARHGGNYIAGALNLNGADTLYGRYWGCVEDHPFLHFEICYHQAIDYAIAHRLARVEAGAQGPHKLARGYVPVTVYSAHHIAHPGLRDAVAHYLEHEREHISLENRALATYAPFRNTSNDGGSSK